MKNIYFSDPVGVWIHDGDAQRPAAGPVIAHLRVTVSGEKFRWKCRFSPGRHLRKHSVGARSPRIDTDDGHAGPSPSSGVRGGASR